MPTYARFSAAALCALAVLSCSRTGVADRKAGGADARSAATETVKPFALVKTSAAPLWFEFGPEGPAAVAGPQDSSLTPFEPWPLARRCAGFVVRGGAAAVAVNREGFLFLAPRGPGETALYRVADAERFAPYSVASVFSYRGAATALLYRDRFFVDPTGNAPEPRALSAPRGGLALAPAALPALAAFPAAAGWDVEALSPASDGRLVLRATREGTVAYASAPSADGEPAELSAGAYRSALLPRPARAAAGPLKAVLEAAARDLSPGGVAVATVVGSGADFPESYLVAGDGNADAEVALAASSQEVERVWAFRDEKRALLLYPDGRLLSSSASGAAAERGKLPALPEGFSYTGVAAVGSLLAAFWEEQDGWAVGSAGFLLVNAAP